MKEILTSHVKVSHARILNFPDVCTVIDSLSRNSHVKMAVLTAMGELRRSLAILYAPPLLNLQFFYIDSCCLSNQKILLLAINNAMASSPKEGAAIDS